MNLVTRVVIADRDVLGRNLLRLVCQASGLPVVGETASLDELLDLCREERPDVLVTADVLAGGPIEGSLAGVLSTGCSVIVLADDRSPERLTSLLEKGASGYLLRDTAPDEVAHAIRAVASGTVALHPFAASTILEQWRALRLQSDAAASGGRVSPAGLRPRGELTAREYDVLVAMADGLAAKAIARRLGVALKTVENHKIRVFDKLGVRTQAHAVSLAIGQGLLNGGARTAPVGAEP